MSQRHEQRLMDSVLGHDSHGTIHARAQAEKAGIPTERVVEDQLPPL